MSRGRLVLIVGTRPDFIKCGPIAAELRRLGTPLTIINSGQHTTLLEGNPARRDLGGALSLNLPGHPDPLHYVVRATAALVDVLDAERPVAAVIVQGDTGTALAGARAAKALNMPLAHVEAGLRSGSVDDPWPEEGFRREITTLADWHYAPTRTALQNLLNEGVRCDTCHLTGNPVVSALDRYTPDGLTHVENPTPQILVTMHRREWLQQDYLAVREMIGTLALAASKHPTVEFVWPMHPSVVAAASTQRPDEWQDDVRDWSSLNLRIVPPLPYEQTVHFLRHSMGVITDSGGLTEEAATLGIPTICLRHHTDRPEALQHGIARLLPPTPDGMTKAVQILAGQYIPRTPSDCFGSPEAASTIARHLASLT